MTAFSGTRPAAVAGQFYPGSAERLRREMEDCVPPPARPRAGHLRAMIVPHAGTAYSGPTAGRAYALLRSAGEIRRVAVLAPSHRVAFRGISLGDYAAFQTPLGTLPVDTRTCADMVGRSSLIVGRRDAHEYEHALEVQLPFLQTVLTESFELVPMVCGDLRHADVRSLAPVLASVLNQPDTLIVVSSDFTHYGRSFGYLPFVDHVQKRLSELDHGAIDRIRALDLAGFEDYVERTGATVCGRVPIALLLAILRESDPPPTCEVLAYTTSGEMTHDDAHSVSYASLVFLADASTADCAPMVELDDAQKRFLLGLARRAISARLQGDDLPIPHLGHLQPPLNEEAAVFVTLHTHGRLRGCIGHLQATEALYLNVIHNALGAAFQDPRFAPLALDELPDLSLDISVLTPAVPIAGPEEIVIGRHGVILERGHNRAVFLPQVAPEQGWDVPTMLDHLAAKAGLPANGWRRGAQFKVFEAIVFGDEDTAG